VQVAYSIPQDVEAPVVAAAAERPGKPILLRIQPQLYRSRKDGADNYWAWPKVSWTIECQSVREVADLRKALEVFFEVAGQQSIETVRRALDQAARHVT